VIARRTALLALAVAMAAPPLAARQAAPRRDAPGAVDTFDAAWRIIRETHFDPTFNGVDWTRVGDELRPRAAAAETPDALRDVIREMLGRLGQSHFALIPAGVASGARADQSGSPGFDFRLDGRDAVVVAVDPEGPASGAVKPGWAITSIDGRTLDQMLGPLGGPTDPPLARFEAWRVVTSHVRGPIGSRAAFTFTDERGAPAEASLRRDPEPGQRVQFGHFPAFALRTARRRVATPAGRPAGLIAFSVWMAPVDPFVQQAVDAFRAADALVLDLRGNPGGLAAMIMGVAGHFLREPVLLGRMKTRDGELRFTANPRRVSASGAGVEPFGGPVAILIDDLTGSASECFTGALQSIGRARVFGRRSMGQALPALFQPLPNGDVLLYAFGDFVTPSGVRLEGRGVVPDVEVPLSRAALAAGRDEALEAALRWIDDDLRLRRRL
jgi:carboxyl-terminal processing protease